MDDLLVRERGMKKVVFLAVLLAFLPAKAADWYGHALVVTEEKM
ncbi:MAG: hypothetical protein UW09_C0002G0162 [candidate division TM6 bacterium GW2011_GWF2_43_87]|nr:MAG: hypothetical protein UW09_C0002G0162 [candidate division TM6 bacterium GW2011_GWF2_43_87]